MCKINQNNSDKLCISFLKESDVYFLIYFVLDRLSGHATHDEQEWSSALTCMNVAREHNT